MDFKQLLLVAFLVESLIQTIKPIYDRKRGFSFDSILAMAVGIGFCFVIKANLFQVVNLHLDVGNKMASEIVEIVLTGIIASRGSNLVHDMFKFVQNSALPAGSGAFG